MEEVLLNRFWKAKNTNEKYFAIVDDEDFERVNKLNWTRQVKGALHYATNKGCLLHRFILNVTGKTFIDHINGNGLDCQKHNLRIATLSQNMMNRRSIKKTSSKYKGVYWHKVGKKWNARITLNNTRYHLGLFTSEEEAALVYNLKAKELFGEFARINTL